MDFLGKMAKLFFEKYGPDINPKPFKWCCGHNLTSFKLFSVKKNLMKV